MNLTDQQKETVKKWVAEGKGVSEIQRLLSSEFGIDMMYIDVRFLIDDIGAQIPSSGEKAADSDSERPADLEQTADSADFESKNSQPDGVGETVAQSENTGGGSGGVRVSVSPIQRPGTVMSGDVVFSDGGTAEWVLDNSGRLGLNPSTTGYTPPQSDLPEFQQKLREALGA